MAKIVELKIKNQDEIYKELTKALSPYREEPTRSVLFIVEGTKKNPLIGLRYPGKKVKKRELKKPRANSALWANLYDFEVIPYKNKKELKTKQFTFEQLVRDFDENKKMSKKFWTMLEELHENNTITKEPPTLSGIDSKIYLLVVKWIWIQEDFNYRFNSEEVESPVKYVLETRTGNPTRKGAGRAKFFAVLVLLKYGFSFEQVKKIIPLY